MGVSEAAGGDVESLARGRLGSKSKVLSARWCGSAQETVRAQVRSPVEVFFFQII